MPESQPPASANAEITVVAPYLQAATGSKQAAARPPTGRSSSRTSGYRSPRGVGDWLIATGLVGIALALLNNVLDYQISAGVEQALATNRAAVSDSTFHALIGQMLTASRCLYGSALLGAVLLLCWFYRIVANLPRLNARDSRVSPGWAVAFFFIPFANLLYPFNILKEAWRGSDPDHALEDGYSWQRNRITPLIGVWWTMHLVAAVAGFFSAAVMAELTHHDLASWVTTFRFLALLRYVYMIDHLLLIALVARLDKRQDRRRQRLQEIIAARNESAPEGIFVPSPALPSAVAVVALAGMAFVVGLPASVNSPTMSSGWRNFASPDGRFTIDMPGPAIEPDRFAESGRVGYYTFQNDTSEFTVIELAVGGDPAPTDDFLRTHLKKAVEFLQIPDHATTVDKTSFITQPDGTLGLEALFTFKRDGDRRQGTARFFMKGGVLYEVIDSQQDDINHEGDSRRFQNSFRLR